MSSPKFSIGDRVRDTNINATDWVGTIFAIVEAPTLKKN